MTATIRKQIQRSKEAAKGLKRIELTLTPEEQKLLGPRPAQALKVMIKAELEKAPQPLPDGVKYLMPSDWPEPHNEACAYILPPMKPA